MGDCVLQVDEGDLAQPGATFACTVELPARLGLLPDGGELVPATCYPLGQSNGAPRTAATLRLTMRVVEALKTHSNVEYTQLMVVPTDGESENPDLIGSGAANVYVRSTRSVPFLTVGELPELPGSVEGRWRVDWPTDTEGPAVVETIVNPGHASIPRWLSSAAILVRLSEQVSWAPISGGFTGSGTARVDTEWALLRVAPHVEQRVVGAAPSKTWLAPLVITEDRTAKLYDIFPTATAERIP